MADLRFESSLSIEEIENNFKDVDFLLVSRMVYRKHLLMKEGKQLLIPLQEKALFLM